MINQAMIYYFSGTGNARNVAHWIAEVATEKQIPVSMFDLAKIDRKNIPPPPQNAMLGFCGPTHGFNFPPVVMYFIFRFPKANGNKVFLVNTRAGMKLSKLFLPGLSGIALWLAAVVLWIKGYKIVGLRSIDLPSNWISLHPGLREQVVQSIHERCKRISQKFAGNIFSNKKDMHAFYDIIQDMIIAPVSLGYFFIGRFIFAKSFYANTSCDNCNVCIRNCPVKAIITVNKRPFWTYRCESCMRCMNDCPKRAIETAHGFIVGILYFTSAVVIWYFWKLLSALDILPGHSFTARMLSNILEMMITFTVVVLSYRLLHYLIKLPGIGQMIKYTSFTRYKFWRRYKGR